MEPGTLYLIPTVLSEGTQDSVITQGTRDAIANLDYFLTENLRTSRRYISSLNLGLNISELHFELLNKDSDENQILELLQPVLEGRSAGILSESGCPGIADPGSLAVELAHQFGISVVPLTGPSSILLALMASGLNGQGFSFHGYLPIREKERAVALRSLEKKSLREGTTEIFIETPYRNEQMLQTILRSLHPSTRLCIARDITGKDEWIRTRPVGKWKKEKVKLHKLPAVFLIQG